MSRKVIADALKLATSYYLLDKGYSCHTELGLCRGGTFRGDVVAVNLKGAITVVETKSCVADYSTDIKLKSYLQYCNRLYLAFYQPVYERLKDRLKLDLKGTGIGVLVLDKDSGRIVAKTGAKSRTVEGRVRRTLVIRMAWRSGTSKRNTKTKTVFIK